MLDPIFWNSTMVSNSGFASGSVASGGHSSSANGNGFSSPDTGNGYSSPGNGNGYSSPGNGNGFSSPDSGNGFSSPGNGNGYSSPGNGNGNGNGFSSPTNGYTPPANGYSVPTNGYASPTSGYGSPTGGYVSPTNSYSPSGGTDYTGSDICGNGGCKSPEEYCSFVKKNGQSDPKCGAQGSGSSGYGAGTGTPAFSITGAPYPSVSGAPGNPVSGRPSSSLFGRPANSVSGAPASSVSGRPAFSVSGRPANNTITAAPPASSCPPRALEGTGLWAKPCGTAIRDGSDYKDPYKGLIVDNQVPDPVVRPVHPEDDDDGMCCGQCSIQGFEVKIHFFDDPEAEKSCGKTPAQGNGTDNRLPSAAQNGNSSKGLQKRDDTKMNATRTNGDSPSRTITAGPRLATVSGIVL